MLKMVHREAVRMLVVSLLWFHDRWSMYFSLTQKKPQMLIMEVPNQILHKELIRLLVYLSAKTRHS
jgi:hypothetical protein